MAVFLQFTFAILKEFRQPINISSSLLHINFNQTKTFLKVIKINFLQNKKVLALTTSVIFFDILTKHQVANLFYCSMLLAVLVAFIIRMIFVGFE